MKRKSLFAVLVVAALVGVSTAAWANGSQEAKSKAAASHASTQNSSASTGGAGSNSAFITVASSHDYSQTVSQLQRAIKNDGLMILGQVNQQSIMSMTGLNLEGAQSFLVGNPRVGKQLFGMTAEAATVIPGRISVWAQNGTTYVGYFEPSVLMGMISPSLVKPGAMLDNKFHQIVHDATK